MTAREIADRTLHPPGVRLPPASVGAIHVDLVAEGIREGMRRAAEVAALFERDTRHAQIIASAIRAAAEKVDE